jgi:hypothetical protein
VPAGYETILRPATSVPDVAYWCNAALVREGVPMCAVNCAVEESTIADRVQPTPTAYIEPEGPRGTPQAHDALVARELEPQDVVVVSMGGNDVVLKPRPWTIFMM